MPMTSWNDRSYYSIAHDGHVARVSGYDEHHREFWVEIPKGKGYADRRKAALERIMEHIDAGDPPGEVKEKA